MIDHNKMLIADYIREVYVSETLGAKGKPPAQDTIQNLNRTAALFGKMLGREPRIEDISCGLLTAYELWLASEGYRHRTVASYTIDLRSIGRRVLGSNELPLLTGVASKQRPSWQPTCEDPDSLAYLWRERYLPAKALVQSEHSQRLYRHALRNFGECLGREPMKGDLTDETVTSYLVWARDNWKLAPQTVNQRRAKLLAFWNWLARKRIVDQFPDVPKIPEPQLVPRAWKRDELAALFAACRNVPGHIGDTPASDWWAAFHLCLWDTGERTGAMLAIRWDWLELNTGDLLVPGHVRKGGKKAMPYVLRPETRKAISRLQTHQTGDIFYWPQSRASFYHHYTRLLKRAGLPTGRKYKPQRIRRTFASFIEAAGGNATDALAHSDRRVTDASYIDPTIAKKDSPNKLLFGLDEKGGAA